MENLLLKRQKMRIDEGEYSEAMLFALILIDSFANIEYGYDGWVNEKYRNWFKEYAVNKFDVLKIKFNGLDEYKINKEEISTSTLNSIQELDLIIYKFRCSYAHSEITKIHYKDNGDESVVKLWVNEDNVLDIKDNTIRICPIFFSKWIYFAIIEYTDEIITNTTDTEKSSRYETYINYSPQKTTVSIKPKAIRLESVCSLDIESDFYVKTDDIVTIKETYFEVYRKEKIHRCEYCRAEFKQTDTEEIKIKYFREYGGIKNFIFKNNDIRLKEIKAKIE